MQTRRITQVPGGPELEYQPPELGEFMAFRSRFDRARLVYVTLERARQSFVSGKAEYADAAEQLGHLVDETNKAAAELVTACSVVDRWFTVGRVTPSAVFKDRGDEFIAFCSKWIDDQKPSEGLLGNSSRARSASARRSRPAIAKSARGSSATKTAASVAPGGGPASS